MKKDDGAPRRSVAGGRHQALDAAVSSYAANASRIASRTAFCAVVSTTGRSRAKLRRSPLIAYCRAGNVTLRPAPVRRSQIPKPISFKPASTPSLKWSSASPSFPGGLPLSLGTILTVRLEVVVWVVAILSSIGTVMWWFLRIQRNPTGTGHVRTRGDVRRRSGGPLSRGVTGCCLPGTSAERVPRDGPLLIAQRRRRTE